MPRADHTRADVPRAHRQVIVAVQQNGFAQREMIAGICQVAQACGDWDIHYMPDLGSNEALARSGLPWIPDGILVYSESPAIERLVRTYACPSVDLAAREPPFLVPGYDEEEVGRLAARHLIARGYTALAAIRIDRGIQARFAGFLAEAARSKLRVIDLEVSWSDLAAPPGSDPFTPWLARLPLPCGLFADTDRFAQAVCSVASRLGLQVPDELGIIGVDADPLLSRLSPIALTSVSIPFIEAGQHAGRALRDLMAGKAVRASGSLSAGVLHESASTDRLANDDQLVGRIRRWIDENLAAAAGTEAIAEAFAMNRRTLERRLMAATGRSVLEEIHRQRLIHGRRLLRQGASVQATAAAVGLTPSRFVSWFHTVQGLTPGAYQKVWRNASEA